jgi:hypothetical protein
MRTDSGTGSRQDSGWMQIYLLTPVGILLMLLFIEFGISGLLVALGVTAAIAAAFPRTAGAAPEVFFAWDAAALCTGDESSPRDAFVVPGGPEGAPSTFVRKDGQWHPTLGTCLPPGLHRSRRLSRLLDAHHTRLTLEAKGLHPALPH